MANRILLADDSITIQKVVNLTFADEGIEVVAVNNGDVAERRLADVRPDLVLADIFMPGKNGYELCEAIKEDPQFCNVPVVLLVGAFEPFDQVEARRVRADAHLTKPFESRTLVETVRRLISASAQTTTAPVAPMAAAVDGPDEAVDAHSAGTESAPLASHLAGTLDLSATMVAGSVAPSAPRVRNTGELVSPSPDVRQEAYDFVNVDAPDAVSATLTDTSERFEPLEFSPNGDFSPAEIAPPFDLDIKGAYAGRLSQDPGPPETFETAGSQDPISFGTEPGALLDVDVRGTGEGEDWFKSDSFEITKPDRFSEGRARRSPAGGSPLSYQSPDFTLQTDTGKAASEASTETATATLLAVDEPLGDVLFDEGVSIDSLAPMPSSDSLGFEFAEPDMAEIAMAGSTQFDLVDFGEAPAPDASFAVVEDTLVEHLVAQATPALEGGVESAAADPLSDLHATPNGVAGELDWTTPRAAAYSTAQLDSVVMPIDTAAYLEDHSGGHDAEQGENTEEATFTTSAIWTEEEARFTPIDIEGVAVDEGLPEGIGPGGTGFEFSPVPAEQPPASGNLGAVSPANGTPAAAVSSAAIEEIVRRVVTEMSESVVREVAWEVVPDCVERVIEQLTRESLSKRA